MTEKEYIEREAAEKIIDRFAGYLDDDMIFRIKYALRKHIPSAYVMYVKHAKWAYCKLHGQSGYYCSECGTGFADINPNAELIAKSHDYCPKCGAKMDGG